MKFDFKWIHFPIDKTENRLVEKYILTLPYIEVSIEFHDEWKILLNETTLKSLRKFKSVDQAKNFIETDIHFKMNDFIKLNKDSQ
jgi:hypothetical protein